MDKARDAFKQVEDDPWAKFALDRFGIAMGNSGKSLTTGFSEVGQLAGKAIGPIRNGVPAASGIIDGIRERMRTGPSGSNEGSDDSPSVGQTGTGGSGSAANSAGGSAGSLPLNGMTAGLEVGRTGSTAGVIPPENSGGQGSGGSVDGSTAGGAGGSTSCQKCTTDSDCEDYFVTVCDSCGRIGARCVEYPQEGLCCQCPRCYTVESGSDDAWTDPDVDVQTGTVEADPVTPVDVTEGTVEDP